MYSMGAQLRLFDLTNDVDDAFVVCRRRSITRTYCAGLQQSLVPEPSSDLIVDLRSKDMSEASTRPLTKDARHDDSAYGGNKFDVEQTKIVDPDLQPELQLNRKGVGGTT